MLILLKIKLQRQRVHWVRVQVIKSVKQKRLLLVLLVQCTKDKPLWLYLHLYLSYALYVTVVFCLLTALSSGKDTWQENCVTQTTSWSPCSKTCGRGVSLRITNANKQCRMVKERRLCNIRPCEVDITKHIKVEIFSGYSNPLNSKPPSASTDIHFFYTFVLPLL